jgi:hypothetical protein
MSTHPNKHVCSIACGISFDPGCPLWQTPAQHQRPAHGTPGWRQHYSGPEAARLDRQYRVLDRWLSFPIDWWCRLLTWLLQKLPTVLWRAVARKLRPYLLEIHDEEHRKGGQR